MKRHTWTNTTVRCIVLDAMGVIFSAADDVEQLLIPFVIATGGTADKKLIRSTYIQASLGTVSADEFWISVGLEPRVEDTYLAGHSLVDGVMNFLRLAHGEGLPIWCLSNDVGRWSQKLRMRFGIDNFLTGAIISSDVLSRKPSPKIYECLLDSTGHSACNILFLDDRDKNIESARGLGIEAIKFGAGIDYSFVAKRLFGKSN